MAETTIRLRPFRLSDLDDIRVMAQEPHVQRWSNLADDPAGWLTDTIAGVHGLSREVCASDADRVLGRVSLRMPEQASGAVRCRAVRPSDQPAGELGYWLLPAARGRGIAHAAVRAMVGWAAAETDLRSLVLDIEIGNAPSMRLAGRLGAERREPGHEVRDRQGVMRDLFVFVIALDAVRAGRTAPRG